MEEVPLVGEVAIMELLKNVCGSLNKKSMSRGKQASLEQNLDYN